MAEAAELGDLGKAQKTRGGVVTATTSPGCRYSGALALGCSTKYLTLLRVTSALGVSSSLNYFHLILSFLIILLMITSFSLLAFLDWIIVSGAFFIPQTLLDCFQVEQAERRFA